MHENTSVYAWNGSQNSKLSMDLELQACKTNIIQPQDPKTELGQSKISTLSV